MRKFLPTLVCAISIVSAGVLDNIDELRVIGLEGDVNNNNEKSGTQRISDMTHEDLIRQKFLLDILQNVNEPIANKELLQISNAAPSQLIGDQSLYSEGIDDVMSHVIELSRSQQLLDKNEIFTISNEEHVRQMIGLYRLLVGARDWDTLQKNLIYARQHVNGVLLVNSLLLAIRDRDDTQNLIIPGLHEILPELYLDEDLIERTKNINLNQLISAQTTTTTTTKTMEPHHSGILEMIGLNKLLHNKNNKHVGSLDRRELWMPWREMRMEIQSRKVGKTPAHVVSIRDDDRIVVPATQSQDTVDDASGLKLLTEDVGFQAFLQTFVNDLCLNEKDVLEKNEQQMAKEQTRAGLMLQSGFPKQVKRSGAEGVKNIQWMDIDTDNDRLLPMGRRQWSRMNRENIEFQTNEQQMNQDQERARIGRVSLNRNMGSVLQSGIRNQVEPSNREGVWNAQGVDIDADNERLLPTGRRHWSQTNQDESRAGLARVDLNKNVGSMMTSGIRSRFGSGLDINRRLVGSGLPTHSADDENILYVNPRRQHAGAAKQLYSRGGQKSTEEGVGSDEDWSLGSIGSNQANMRTRFMDTIRARDIDVDEDRQDVDDKYGWNTQWALGMPMDWNRQMAMHRQRIKNVDNRQGGYNGGDQQTTRMGKDLPQVDINDERLLPISQRKFKQLNGSIKQGEQQQETNERWTNGNVMGNARGTNQNSLSSIQRNAVDRDAITRERMWMTTAARGMGNIGVHEEQGMSGQHRSNSGIDASRWTKNNEGRQNTEWDDDDDNTDRRTMKSRGRQNMRWNDDDSDEDRWTLKKEGRQSVHWDDEDDDTNRRTINNKGLRVIHWDNERDLDIQDEEGNRMGIGSMWRHRSPRSLSNRVTAGRQRSIEQMRGGELVLHNLQQLVARINLEQISFGIGQDELESQDDKTPSRVNNPRLINSSEERFAVRLNDMRLQTRRNRSLLDKINAVEQRLQIIIQQEVRRKIGTAQKQNVRKQAEIDQVIGDALMSKHMGGAQEMNILNVLREIIQQTEDAQGGTHKLSQVSLNVRDPVVVHLLKRIVHIADVQRQQQLGDYRKEDLQMQGVTINEVKVDKLRTCVDTKDVDLINALDATQKNTLTNDRTRMVVARQQRLNHKDFTINIDVTAERNQRVIVRTLLGPKIDSSTQLNAQRKNFILLDAYVVDLRSGRNQIKRKSRDINWTAKDTTPFTVIYKRVMQALNGNQVDITLDQVQGQTCRFPHRLLLPHGRVDGLPMQMLVVISPVEDEDRTVQQWTLDQRVCGIGMSSANLDLRPLGFPLDRPVENAQEVVSLPNMHLIDVQIYHDKQVKVHDWMNDLNI